MGRGDEWAVAKGPGVFFLADHMFYNGIISILRLSCTLLLLIIAQNTVHGQFRCHLFSFFFPRPPRAFPCPGELPSPRRELYLLPMTP